MRLPAASSPLSLPQVSKNALTDKNQPGRKPSRGTTSHYTRRLCNAAKRRILLHSDTGLADDFVRILCYLSPYGSSLPENRFTRFRSLSLFKIKLVTSIHAAFMFVKRKFFKLRKRTRRPARGGHAANGILLPLAI